MDVTLPSVTIMGANTLRAACDLSSSALLVIDVQVDFVAAHGYFGRAGADMSTMEAAVDAISGVIDAARAAGLPVIFVRALLPDGEDSPAMLRLLAHRGVKEAAAICRPGTPGANYHRIAPLPGELEVAKRRYDAFLGTDLEAELRARDISTLLVCGVSTDCCVDTTVRAAFLRDFDVFVIADGCAAGAPWLHHGALAAMERNVAIITDSAAVRKALAGSGG